LCELIKKINSLLNGKKIQITQIKQKFGELRVYFKTNDQSINTNRIDQLIEQYRLISCRTCEYCGCESRKCFIDDEEIVVCNNNCWKIRSSKHVD
jgi:hypothetical protein